MKNQITFLISFILFAFYSLQAQVTQEWARRYNGPENTEDVGRSLAVDGSGNVYVTGHSGLNPNYDYATIKYNSSGDSLWVQRYNGPGDSYDDARAIAVDDSGNVYVTGISGSDYATIKYNTSGIQQWVQRYYGPGGFVHLTPSLAVDDSGNVYVAGYSIVSGLICDYATIKYNSSGDQQWVQRYNGLDVGDIWDFKLLIAVDDTGNVYVTGSSYGGGTGSDYATIKYNSSGDSLWVARYNGPENGWDQASSLTVDDPGNVYVTGQSYGGIDADYATIKYNSSGVQQWAQRYNGDAHDIPNSVVVDGSGNVYVTGGSFNLTVGDYITIKYSSSGDSLWVARYNRLLHDYDGAYSLAVDGSGNVYVTGSILVSLTDADYTTIKYNSSGVQQWIQEYDGPGNGWDVASSIAVDGSGNVYVTGSSSGNELYYDYATIKYSQSTGISQISNSNPEKFSLSQNYPNPFNPVTNLEFGISKLRFVSLKIYDVLGKEVGTLVNANLNPGTYKYNFDASFLSSGVYFYRLQTDNFSETKKMTLIK